MDAVPLAHEDEVDALLHQRRAVPADGDDVLEIGDSPALGDERRTNAEHSDEKKGLGGAALQRRNEIASGQQAGHSDSRSPEPALNSDRLKIHAETVHALL